MINNILSRYWREILIVLFLAVIVLLFKENWKNKQEKERIKANYSSIAHDVPHTDFPIDQILTKKEFKVFYRSLIDTINKKIDGIKPKNITRVTNIYQTYHDTTIYNYVSPMVSPGVFDISYVDTCFGFSGLFNLQDTTVHLTEKWFSNDIHIIDFWKRRNLFGLKWLPKIGRKLYYRKTIDNCNGDFRIENIKIVKNGKEN